MAHVRDAIQNKFVGRLSNDIADATHEFGNKRPGQRRNEGTQQTGSTTCQTRSREIGNKALLVYHLHNALPRNGINVLVLVKHARDGSFRYASQASNILYSQLLCHDSLTGGGKYHPPNVMKYAVGTDFAVTE